MEDNKKYRIENDLLGKREIEIDRLYGIHTTRSVENFPLSGNHIHSELIKAYGIVKYACLSTAKMFGIWKEQDKINAMEQACNEMASGQLNDWIVVDALQGGAGTSTNMNVNEVIANRALEILGKEKGDYSYISPNDDINIFQSTNDTYPTALKLAAINMIKKLEERVVELQEAFQEKEKEFAHVVKIGRTQLQDAVLTTLGREMGAYAVALSRDRWRIYKCEERLRVVNLGGTAIGTGLGAPRQYIFRVVDTLRNLTGIGFARAENLMEATQNADVFVEVSGILKALATTLFRCANNLRLMSSGPQGGLAEIRLPERQAGSSIMPGKVNPVIPEAVAQAALMVMGYDQTLAMAVAGGNLELSQYMPLIAHSLLSSLQLLSGACEILARHCVNDIKANEDNCKRTVEASSVIATILVPEFGYDKVSELVKKAKEDGISVKNAAINKGWITQEKFNELISPEAVTKLGSKLKREE